MFKDTDVILKMKHIYSKVLSNFLVVVIGLCMVGNMAGMVKAVLCLFEKSIRRTR
jgi:hypothetical protein